MEVNGRIFKSSSKPQTFGSCRTAHVHVFGGVSLGRVLSAAGGVLFSQLTDPSIKLRKRNLKAIILHAVTIDGSHYCAEECFYSAVTVLSR